MNNVEKWRRSRGLTYQDIADQAGCSRQYAMDLCRKGTAGIARAFRVLIVAQGALKLEDFLPEHEKDEMIDLGFLPLPEGFYVEPESITEGDAPLGEEAFKV